MFAAQVGTQTPKFHVTLRKAYGFGGCIMGMLGFNGQTANYAFPGATLGAMPASGSSKAMRTDDEVTLFDSTGIALEDAAVLLAAFQGAGGAMAR